MEGHVGRWLGEGVFWGALVGNGGGYIGLASGLRGRVKLAVMHGCYGSLQFSAEDRRTLFCGPPTLAGSLGTTDALFVSPVSQMGERWARDRQPDSVPHGLAV